MAGESKLFQEPTALNTINPFRNASFPLPDRERDLFFSCSVMLSWHLFYGTQSSTLSNQNSSLERSCIISSVN